MFSKLGECSLTSRQLVSSHSYKTDTYIRAEAKIQSKYTRVQAAIPTAAIPTAAIPTTAIPTAAIPVSLECLILGCKFPQR